MADDVVLPGTGDTIAADEINGKKIQRIKLILGSDGVNDGDVSKENPMPVLDDRATSLLFQILNALLSPANYDSSQQRQRMTTVLEAGSATIGNISTVVSVTALADQTNIGGRPAQMLIDQTNLLAWQAVHRSRIT
jgi:hypothetical protein